jgi:WhiB family transcriptional regulator, redox-sensing transcriptional regulator
MSSTVTIDELAVLTAVGDLGETELIDMNWRDRAACRTQDPELFFPIGTTGPALDQLTEAKSVCYRCPVIGECLAWALDTGQRAGVWGGLSEDERHRLRQRNGQIWTRT